MPVQEQVIPYLLGNNNDVVALAQTGTGKTAAYGLPLLQKVSEKLDQWNTKNEVPAVQALILSPTRELCLQITDDLKNYSKYIDGLHVLAVYGGASIETQIRQLKKGVQVVVATPGRLVDLMERGVAKLDHVENVVLDEADEMLSMGFSESIDKILEGVPQERNTLLFSATMSKEIERISKNYLRNATEIQVGSRNEGAEKVNHIYYLVSARDKYLALKRIADFYPEIYAIVFCRTRLETQEIADKLIQDGYNADSLHGELSQAQRDLVMGKFRQHRLQFLIATDVAARGIDVEDLTHVINYGLPDDIESYTHRSGRTGRAGKQGTSICIIHVKEKHKVRAIEKQISKQFVAGVLPKGEEICHKQLMKVISDIEHVEVNEEAIAPFLDDIYRKFDLMEKEDVIKRMVSMEFNHFLDYYKNAPEIIQPTGKNSDRDSYSEREGRRDRKSGGERRERGARGFGAEEGYTRLFINIGRLDHLHIGEFMGLINRLAGKKRFEIGRIDLMKSFSFFEVPTEQAQDVVRTLSGADFNGRAVNIEVSDNASHAPAQHRAGAARPARRDFKAPAERRKEQKAGRDSGKKPLRTARNAGGYVDEFADFDLDFKPSRGSSKGKPEWAQFFDGQVEAQPFYGKFAKKKKSRAH